MVSIYQTKIKIKLRMQTSLPAPCPASVVCNRTIWAPPPLQLCRLKQCDLSLGLTPSPCLRLPYAGAMVLASTSSWVSPETYIDFAFTTVAPQSLLAETPTLPPIAGLSDSLESWYKTP